LEINVINKNITKILLAFLILGYISVSFAKNIAKLDKAYIADPSYLAQISSSMARRAVPFISNHAPESIAKHTIPVIAKYVSPQIIASLHKSEVHITNKHYTNEEAEIIKIETGKYFTIDDTGKFDTGNTLYTSDIILPTVIPTDQPLVVNLKSEFCPDTKESGESFVDALKVTLKFNNGKVKEKTVILEGICQPEALEEDIWE